MVFVNKQALVFGSSSDIGRCISTELVRAGYIVTGTYFNTRGFGHKLVHCDIRDLTQVDRVFDYFSVNTLDVVVLSAFPFLENDPFDWSAFMEAQRFHAGHMRAMVNSFHALKRGGRIVNILGQCVRNGLPAAPHYSAFFAQMHNFAKSVNGNPRYGKSDQINMLDVLLAAVDTREWNGVSQSVKAAYEQKMGKFIQPEEVARRVLFELSCQTMATELVIDGSVLV
ncbi:MAG: hypothetical protein UW64_C0018G0010 [Microgenomates group bacterium GW2011_GWC1_44_37]|nr:MAG: hypothetical protein UW64_C0018G0010 [Microgenomates group bacterium GW2011_GWC1_44_37]